MVNILTILVECGVANKIKSKQTINADEMQALITQVENEYGISRQYSQDAILVWAATFDITVSVIKTSTTDNSLQEIIEPIKSKPAVYVQGNAADYSITQKTDGYYITQFNSFEDNVMIIPSMIDGKQIVGIGEKAFEGCSLVREIKISEGIEIIESNAFASCRLLSTVTLPSTLQRIEKSAFSGTRIKRIELPQSVKYVGEWCFSMCTELEEIIFGDKVTEIEENTFWHCENLSNVKLPAGLQRIKSNAFCLCFKLKTIRIPMGTQIIESDAFAYSSLTSIYIPPTVTTMGNPNNIKDHYNTKHKSFGVDDVFGKSTWALTIYCTAGSVAMEYARKNNIKCARGQF